ncbi:dihydrodipicolinate synthase family protein [Chitinophaga sp. SYP-B3965]|uniref:dihydrodipicolinate synthase family protein n=1 Tax=Chitinophaga sp. SYP-B3965 TaxID=2663120 RepID=UPI001299680C|nr:dihydrodipicolinate synthase family protein [Chitinophaga sp. SYP-B3965]MRG48331.1 dihydrodipicolinate synthase family protein [Chitinophaga sp. SYP-B3965]
MAQLKENIKALLQKGAFIPAHPLALNEDLSIDEKSQRRLTRYYMASGVDGVAVGVHTTQFEIRQPEFNYLEPVLRMAAEEVGDRPLIKVAGICGPLESAVKDAKLANKYGYDLGLLSMGGLQSLTEEELIERTKAIADMIPVFGFYLQPAVGGRVLSYDFWKAFAAIPNVQAIKVAAFNRYQTLDVVRAICDTDRADEIVLYTGNDDNIVADLVTPYRFDKSEKRFTGGLLGHYAVWTHKSVELFRQIRDGNTDLDTLLATGIEVTDMNAAIFDPKHAFKGCIAGIHEVLRRQGLMKGIWCLNPHEQLSPGQAEEITRVVNAYPHLVEDEFVKKFLETDH